MYSSMNSRRSSLSLALGAVLLAGLGLAAARPAAAQTIGNAGFESPSLGSGAFAYAYSNTDAQYTAQALTDDQAAQAIWNFGSGSGISGNDSAFTEGNPNAPEGSQVAFLQKTSSFSQTISGFAAGAYTFSFDAAERGNYGGPQDFEVSLDNTLLGVYGPGLLSTSYQSFTTLPVVVDAGSHTLTFTGLNSNPLNQDNTALIDSVSVSPAAVPEASTTVSLGLLLTLGLGGLAVAKKRKSILAA